ncbi:hypothetical protein [Xanthomonas sp. WHRI 8932A]|nr:hypothetical protein [Xanthomonas sp. WHRI 8932A]MEA9565526.1 hypothetical protein [Xanthomonas sp. WHRI 8932A]
MNTAFFIATLLIPLSAFADSDIAAVPDSFVGRWAGPLILADRTQMI